MRLALLVVGFALAIAGPAHAQTTDATRAAARQLATEGVDDFQAGKYGLANEKLNQAFTILRAPSIGLWSARALVQTGRLVQASERYLEVTRIDPKTGDEAVQKQSQLEAQAEYDELQARIPSFTLQLTRRGSDLPLRVSLDGAPVPSSLLGVPVPADPGKHVIEVKQGDLSGQTTIVLSEGQHLNVLVDLAPSQDHPSGAAQSARAQPAAAVAEPAPTERVLGTPFWLAVGLSGGGILFGTVTGAMAASQYGSLSGDCPGDVCEPRHASDVHRLDTLRAMSTTGFVIGGVALASAGVLFLAAPRKSRGGYVQPVFGVGSLGATGAF